MNETVTLANRRKQLRYRANHRGIKEMDIILGRFADQFVAKLDNSELDRLEALMANNDRDLLQWFTGELALPKKIDLELFEKISNFANAHIQSDHSS